MKRWLLVPALIAALVPTLGFAQLVTRDGVTLTQGQETRAEAIGAQLRCLVCQNESVEGSSAALAKQLRVIIRQQVVAGASRRDILRYMVDRYGIFVLLKPPFMRLTWLLYASPLIALGIAFLFAATRRHPPPPPPLDAADRARLDELLR